MNSLYPFFIAFILVFVSELGDKTQLLVLSFSNKAKASVILLGVALGSLFSHGLAIAFGSQISILEDSTIKHIIEFVAYCSFIIFGILYLLPKKEKLTMEDSKKDNLIYKLSRLSIHYFIIVALCIFIGELGDKTFLASIGLGIGYPNNKVSLISGAVCAMVVCNLLSIIFGKILNKYISEKSMQKLSGVLFLLFGILGLISID